MLMGTDIDNWRNILITFKLPSIAFLTRSGVVNVRSGIALINKTHLVMNHFDNEENPGPVMDVTISSQTIKIIWHGWYKVEEKNYLWFLRKRSEQENVIILFMTEDVACFLIFGFDSPAPCACYLWPNTTNLWPFASRPFIINEGCTRTNGWEYKRTSTRMLSDTA